MNHPDNFLPLEGEAYYFGKVFPEAEAIAFFENLRAEIEWKNDEVIIFGKRIVTKRKTAWYGDMDFQYTYSKIARTAMPWTPALLEIKKEVEAISGRSFNSCLLNLYHSGEEGMSWHSDAEAELGKNPVIASLSFGAERKFVLKNKATKEKISVELENGSLLLMAGTTQKYWLHSLPKSKKIKEARINLTFRKISEIKK